MPPRCAANALGSKVQPVLRKTVGAFKEMFASAKGVASEMEGAIPELKVFSKIVDPIQKAMGEAGTWRTNWQKKIDKSVRRLSDGDMEDVLMLMQHGNASEWVGKGSIKLKREAAAELKKVYSAMMEDAGNLPKGFGKRLFGDLSKLKAVNGDINRLDPNNILPNSYQTFLKDISEDLLAVNHPNAHHYMVNAMHAGSRKKFVQQAMDGARAELKRWGKLDGVHDTDLTQAKNYVNNYLRDMTVGTDSQAQAMSNALNGVLKGLNANLGLKLDTSPEQIANTAAKLTSWYSGAAMAGRPALAIRNLSQSLLGATKVGYTEWWSAVRDVTGKRRKEMFDIARQELNIPSVAEAFEATGAGGGAVFGTKLTRLIKQAQDIGMIPFQGSDQVNRVISFWTGHKAITKNADDLLKRVISEEQFMFRTGLKGSSKVEQAEILSHLRGEIPNVEAAARAYGKRVADSTQFIYGASNKPQAFRGTVGRVFGQFGTWPIGFTEFIHQNTLGAGDAAWTKKFGMNYVAQKAVLSGLGIGLGVDTSSWNFANPLTFQGGPWFQGLRDASVLATSLNDFERQAAMQNVTKMISSASLPFGALQRDIEQGREAIADGDPMQALLLGLGFNLRQ